MDLKNLSLPVFFKKHYSHFNKLTPVQEKAIDTGLLEKKSLVVSAPTASGKTLIATMGIVNTIKEGKALYLVPLKALANEKYKEYLSLFQETEYKVVQAVGDIDSPSEHLRDYDLLILTTEKLDSLLRHRVSWLQQVKTIIIDEIHLLNDPNRGPTLEIILTLLRDVLNEAQFIGLSATIGNPQELAEWLKAKLVIDDWRPVELKKGIYHQNKIKFY